MHEYLILITVLDRRLLPFGPDYDNVVYFSNRDDGYSSPIYFRQRFLFGARYYRRFWVRCLLSVMYSNTENSSCFRVLKFI